jgi:hypothetical protein
MKPKKTIKVDVIQNFQDVWLVKMPWAKPMFDGWKFFNSQVQNVHKDRMQVKIISPKMGLFLSKHVGKRKS